MSTRNDFTNLLDLSLRHALKNLVTRQKPPADGRARLLAAAAQQEMAARQDNAQQHWLNISFRFYTGLQEKTAMPGYGNLLDTISVLKVAMMVA